MDATDLAEHWHANKDRPAWVRENREAIMDHVDTAEPIPEGSIYEVRQWLSDYADDVSERLDELVPGPDACTEVIESGDRAGEECGRTLPCQYHPDDGGDGEVVAADGGE